MDFCLRFCFYFHYPTLAMPRKDSTSPATKADLQLIVAQIDELRGEIKAEAEQTRHHFEVVAENLLHDFRGGFADRTSQHDDKLRNHEDRISACERKLELAV